MLINGKAIAKKKEEGLKSRIKELPKAPKLAIILVGDDPASKIYVDLKVQKARELGITTQVRQDLNTDADGIIVQLPLPAGRQAEQELIDKIPLQKDVDGLTGRSPFLPATVKGILLILEEISGSLKLLKSLRNKTVTVVGQGRLVGKPLADYLEKNGCRVIRCDINTPDLKSQTLKADILVAAAGAPNLIKADMVKKGTVVIDVGKDVDFENVKNVAGAITPPVGGVGPLTVISLLENTVEAAARNYKLSIIND